MTAGEAIAQADELRPNAYSVEQKLRWLRRLDGQIRCELEETHGPEGLPRRDEHCSSADPGEFAHPSLSFRTSDRVTGVGIRSPLPEEERIATASVRTGLAMTDGGATAGVRTGLAMTDGGAPALPDAYETDTVLLAPFPWAEGLYTAWLFCQIDLHNGEIQRYNQSLQLLAAAWRSLADWMNRRRMPLGVGTWRM